MPNVTMTIEDDLLRKARKLAAARNTTLTGLVRGYLRQLALREEHTTNSVIAELKECFDTPGVVVGRRTWKRADLHAR